MDPDDELDDEGSSGLLLPPDDRLWRHPSEAAIGTRGRRGNRTHAEVRMWTVALFSGVIGAVLAAGIVYAVGATRTRDVDIPAVERDVDAPTVVTLASVAPAGQPGMNGLQASCVTLIARSSSGTTTVAGVVFRSDGMVLTTADNLGNGQTLTAIVDGTRHVTARLVAADPASDLAVVKLNGSGYDPAPMGSALDLEVGSPIIALQPSDPGGEMQGSIGALGQEVTSASGAQISDLLEVNTSSTLATVGGALVDSHGSVVAIGTELDPGRGVEYATPVDLAREIATELLAHGHVVPVWLGVQGTDLPAAAAAALGVAGGAVIGSVYPGSPAAVADLAPGDVVVGLDGREVRSMAGLIMAVHAEPEGTTVDLDIYRNGRATMVPAVLAARPANIG